MSKRPATRLHLLGLLKLHESPENIVLVAIKRMVTFQHLATYGREPKSPLGIDRPNAPEVAPGISKVVEQLMLLP